MDYRIWIIISLVFAVMEIFGSGFFMIFFAIGAAITAILALFFVDIYTQLTVFLLLSILSLYFFRPMLKETFKISDAPAKLSNVDRLPGALVLVLDEVTRHGGRVKVLHSGETWSAYLAGDTHVEAISASEEAIIERVDGAKLVIIPKS